MRRTSLNCCLALLVSYALPFQAQITPLNTARPNEFYFPQNIYYAEATATSATIEVSFIPGNRSWSGIVGFSTEAGTAQEGVDYTAVEGTLSWDGPALRNIEIPLNPTPSPEERTIKLALHAVESNCVLSRPEATLVIPATPPTLNIAAGASGIQLSWPAAYVDYLVETATDSAPANWLPVPSAPTQTGDQWVVTFPPDHENRLFRLRRSEVVLATAP